MEENIAVLRSIDSKNIIDREIQDVQLSSLKFAQEQLNESRNTSKDFNVSY